MNSKLRNKLEQEVKDKGVKLFLQVEVVSWGLREKSEKLLSVKDLSDKELSHLKSSLLWGEREGVLQEDLESRRVEWER